jgi:hypothetical protein
MSYDTLDSAEAEKAEQEMLRQLTRVGIREYKRCRRANLTIEAAIACAEFVEREAEIRRAI